MRKLLVCFIFIVSALFVGCGTNYDWEPCCRNVDTTLIERISDDETISLQDVLTIAQSRREDIIKPSRDSILALVQEREPQTVDINRFGSSRNRADSISSQEAVYDFGILSDIIRQIYGAYTYFGGDIVFLPVFEQVVYTLLDRKYWDISDFSELIFNSLNDVINDNHFMIDEMFMGNSYSFLIPDGNNAVFDHSENGFRNRHTGLYVKDVIFEGMFLAHEICSILRLSMDSDGEFYYSFVVVRPYDGVIAAPLIVIYENGDYENILLSPMPPFERMAFENVSLQCLQGFPVVTIRQMGFPDTRHGSHRDDARRFLAYAEELRNEPVIIVDIRSNGGGNGLLPIRWLHILLGEIVPGNHWVIEGISYNDFTNAIRNQPRRNPFNNTYEHFRTYSTPEPMGDYHTLLRTYPDRLVSNAPLLILLTDRGTASASEAFADMAFNLDNALVIGQNTGGALHTNMTFPRRYLPNSGIPFGLGRGIHVHPLGHLQEGIGIFPDVWVNGDSLEAVLAMLNLYFYWSE